MNGGTMHQALRIHRLLAVTAAIAMTTSSLGCGGGGSGDPPEISDLDYDVEGLVVGETTMVSGQFAFEDPDGDVLELFVLVRAPDGEELPGNPDMLEGIEDVASGRVTFDIGFAPSQSGTYEFAVWVRDAAGNESNQLTGSFEVAA